MSPEGLSWRGREKDFPGGRKRKKPPRACAGSSLGGGKGQEEEGAGAAGMSPEQLQDDQRDGAALL